MNIARWTSYARAIRKFDWLIAMISIALFAVTHNYVVKIKVKSDFKYMLPEHAPSVVNLNHIEKRVRGTDNLIVLVGGSSWPNIKKFVDDFVVRIGSNMGGSVQRVEYNVSTLRKFYEDNKYLYIDKPDLEEIYRRLKRKIDYEKLKELPFYIDLGEEEPGFTTADIEDKYKGKTSTYKNYSDDYFTSADGKLAAIIIWPKEGATNLDFAKKLIQDLTQLFNQMGPMNYDPDLRIAFGGRLRKMIVEYDAVIGDILKTTLLCLSLVGLLVLAFFRRARMCALMTVNVAQGTLASLSIAVLTIGYLTSQTAFLGAIIVGNGIDYSLILMSRYLEERKDNAKSVEESMSISLAHTWTPTTTSWLTTTAAFFALMATNIKGFSQFGFIGGIGMPLCWCSTYFFLPAWLSLSERIWAIKPKIAAAKSIDLMTPLSRWIFANSRRVMKIGAAAIISSIAFGVWYMPNSLEYNFDKLSFKAPPEKASWEKDARSKINDIFGKGSTTPSVVLAKDTAQADAICKQIEREDKRLGSGYVEKCQSLASFIPADQNDKLAILSDMRALLSSSTLKFLTPKQLEEVEKFKATLDLKPIETANLPPEILRSFKDVDGNLGVVSFVYPQADLWNGYELMKFASIIRKINLPNGETIESSGQPVILADLLRAVTHDGPWVTILSLFMTIVLVWFNFRNWPETTLVTTSLLTGVALLIGLIATIGIKLNFLNFIALPITFGIGVDYSVNVYQRMKQDGFKDIPFSLSKIAGPVALCSLTTTIGYMVLLTSRSRALVTFGAVALMGETVCFLVAIFLLPVIIKKLHEMGLLPYEKKMKFKDAIALIFNNKPRQERECLQEKVET